MSIIQRLLLLPLLMLSIAACGATSVEQQTLVAHEANMGTAINNIYLTGTVEAERLQVTVEYALQRAAAVGTQGGLMISTLEVRGVDTSNLPAPLTPTAPINPTTTAQATQQATSIFQSSLPTAIAPTRDPNATPTSVQITPFATPLPQVTSTPSPVPVDENAILREITTASSVGNDDCASTPGNAFTPQTAEIYIVARAVELPEGTTLITRWFRGDEPLVNFDLTYGYIEDACIWFYADQTNFEFTPGNYSITLEINGLPFGTPIPFTINGGAETTAEATG